MKLLLALILFLLPCAAGQEFLENDTISYIQGVFSDIPGSSVCIDCGSELGIYIDLNEMPSGPSDYGYRFFSASLNCDKIIERYPGKFATIHIALLYNSSAIAEMNLFP